MRLIKPLQFLILIGDVINYTVNVKNTEGNATSNVTVWDELPAGVEVIEESISHEGTYADGGITWLINLQTNQEVNLTYKVKIINYGAFTNTAHVGNLTSNVTINIPNIIPNKTVDKENPNYGENITYTIVLENNAVSDAKGVTVTDVLPSGLVLDESSIGTGTYNPVTRTITWIVDINKGEKLTLTYNVTVNVYGNVTNNVTVGNRTSNVTIDSPCC